MIKCPKDGKECNISMGMVYGHCRHGLPAVDQKHSNGRVCPIYEKVSVNPMIGENMTLLSCEK